MQCMLFCGDERVIRLRGGTRAETQREQVGIRAEVFVCVREAVGVARRRRRSAARCGAVLFRHVAQS